MEEEKGELWLKKKCVLEIFQKLISKASLLGKGCRVSQGFLMLTFTWVTWRKILIIRKYEKVATVNIRKVF